jgi:uncharacterized membrane protein YagU involved in acid resistance
MNRKLALAALAALILLLQAAPSVYASPYGEGILGEGQISVVPEGYIPIYDADDLNMAGKGITALGSDGIGYAWSLSDNYILMNDIAAGSGFVMIGNAEKPFMGIFDGNYHTITGLKMTGSQSSSSLYNGMFGVLNGATVRNLNIADSEIHSEISGAAGRIYAGTVAAMAIGDTVIEGCNVSGTVRSVLSYETVASSIYSGGVLGAANPSAQSSVTVSGCTFSGSVLTEMTSSASVSSTAYSGGIAGYGVNIIVSGCGVSADVTADVTAEGTGVTAKAYAGGIAGYMATSTVTRCMMGGSVNAAASSSADDGIYASAYAGGITGAFESSFSSPVAYTGSTISYCGNTAAVTGNAGFGVSLVEAGGIAGRTNGHFTMSSCYNTGDISADAIRKGTAAVRAGGLTGSLGYGAQYVEYSYSAGTVTAGPDDDVGLIAGRVLSDIEFRYLVAAGADGDKMIGTHVHGVITDTCTAICTIDDMKKRETYQWPSFDAVWIISDDVNGGLPHFASDVSEQYCVLFITALGGTVDMMKVNAGETVVLPVLNEGKYKFIGWFTEPDGNGDEITSLDVTSDAVLYAYWEGITQTEYIYTDSIVYKYVDSIVYKYLYSYVYIYTTIWETSPSGVDIGLLLLVISIILMALVLFGAAAFTYRKRQERK